MKIKEGEEMKETEDIEIRRSGLDHADIERPHH